MSHDDLSELVTLDQFKAVCRRHDRKIKPILVITVDGGPDENPRFPKTIAAAVETFSKFDLDCMFVATEAPGQSAYNCVERRMSPHSRDISGVVLPHDHFGSHLDGC